MTWIEQASAIRHAVARDRRARATRRCSTCSATALRTLAHMEAMDVRQLRAMRTRRRTDQAPCCGAAAEPHGRRACRFSNARQRASAAASRPRCSSQDPAKGHRADSTRRADGFGERPTLGPDAPAIICRNVTQRLPADANAGVLRRRSRTVPASNIISSPLIVT